MGFLMYVKRMGGVKLPPLSKIFKNDPKKLKLTPKLEHIKIFPKHKRKNLLLSLFLTMSALFWQKITKSSQILGKF